MLNWYNYEIEKIENLKTWKLGSEKTVRRWKSPPSFVDFLCFPRTSVETYQKTLFGIEFVGVAHSLSIFVVLTKQVYLTSVLLRIAIAKLRNHESMSS